MLFLRFLGGGGRRTEASAPTAWQGARFERGVGDAAPYGKDNKRRGARQAAGCGRPALRMDRGCGAWGYYGLPHQPAGRFAMTGVWEVRRWSAAGCGHPALRVRNRECGANGASRTPPPTERTTRGAVRGKRRGEGTPPYAWIEGAVHGDITDCHTSLRAGSQ